MEGIPERFRTAAREVVDVLARRDYDDLAARGVLRRGSPDMIRTVVDDYGATITGLPDEAFEDEELIDLGGGEWSLAVDVWTEDEGRSDLSIVLRFYEDETGKLSTELRDIRVM